MKLRLRLSTILFGGFSALMVAAVVVELIRTLPGLQTTEPLPESMIAMGLVAFGAIVAIALLLATWRLVLKPLSQLQIAARAIVQGRVNVRVARPILGELAEVTDAVNFLLDQLARQRQDMTEANARLEETVAARTYELASRNAALLALQTISRTTLEAKSIDLAAQAVTDAVSAATGFPCVMIEHFSPVSGQVVWQAASREAHAVLRHSLADARLRDGVYTLPDGCSHMEWVTQPGNVLVRDEPVAHGELAGWMRLFDCRTCLCAPITSGQRVIGALTLGHPQPGRSNVWLTNWVRTLSAHVGPLLEFLQAQEALLRSEQALGKREAILDAVGFAAEQFLRARDWNAALPHVLQRLGQAADASRVYIFENSTRTDGVLLTSKHAEWVAPGQLLAIDPDRLIEAPYDGLGLERWAERLSRDQSVKGIVKTFPQREREFLQTGGIQSVLVAPIFVNKQWWGFVGFDDCRQEREWLPAEEEALMAAARILGAAIQSARLMDSIHQLAITDSLTGLYNRRRFFDLAYAAFGATCEDHASLAVIMLDADDLKMVNDLFGHQTGDLLLQTLASRLRKLLREEDILARYGGDEFVILLPRTSLPEAQAIANRLMNEINVTPLIAPSSGGSVLRHGVSMSVGLAVGDQRCPDFNTLLNRADQALYMAKQAGKGRIRIWQPSQPSQVIAV